MSLQSPRKPPTIVLFSDNAELTDAWSVLLDRHRQFATVQVYHGVFADVDCRAVVSPTLSFGPVRGEIDQTFLDYFGTSVQTNVRAMIRQKFQGRMPVGRAVMIETEDRQIPYLIATPIMPAPAKLEKDTLNPYLAMRAILRLWRYGRFKDRSIQNLVDSIAISGFGTMVGGVPAEVCAKQQFSAIREVLFPTS